MNKKCFVLVLIMLITLPACGLLKPIPDNLDLSLTTGPDLNPDAEGRSSPVVVRIYELSADRNFKGKDFFDIFDDEKKSLADTLIKKQELELNPNESRKLTIKLNENTKYLGLFAAYRDIDTAVWRKTIKLKGRKPTGIPVYENNLLKARLEKNSIVLN